MRQAKNSLSNKSGTLSSGCWWKQYNCTFPVYFFKPNSVIENSDHEVSCDTNTHCICHTHIFLLVQILLKSRVSSSLETTANPRRMTTATRNGKRNADIL